MPTPEGDATQRKKRPVSRLGPQTRAGPRKSAVGDTLGVLFSGAVPIRNARDRGRLYLAEGRAGFGWGGDFGSRFACKSASVTLELTPEAGTSALAVHKMALRTSLR